MKAMLLLAVAMMPAASRALAAAPDDGNKEARIAARAYGECLVSRDRAAVLDVLRRDDGRDPKIWDRYRALVLPDCARDATNAYAIKFPLTTYRYTLAEAMFVHAYGRAKLPDFASVPPLKRRKVGPIDESKLTGDTKAANAYRVWYNRAVATSDLAVVAECVARRDPVVAAELVNTPVAGPEEATAVAALQSSLAGCTTAGLQSSFDTEHIRGAVAFALFSLADAARPIDRGKSG